VSYDLVIRNGLLVDGSGGSSYRADVGVRGERIVFVGARAKERGRREIDAEGHVVTPGFIDGHTHMDAQAFWDPLGASSCWHGVTTVVYGNCGFTLAPARADARDLVIANLENAEEIPRQSMEAGIEWRWETFREYLDVVDTLPKAINYAVQIGHSALRTWTMGERAFEAPASDDDLDGMAAELRDALEAGAWGFTTSTIDNHHLADGRPVASRLARWSEIEALVGVVGTHGAGGFGVTVDSKDPDAFAKDGQQLLDLAVTTRVPITFGLRRWHLQQQLDLLDDAASHGGRIFGQSRSEPFSHIISFKTRLPFDRLPEWEAVRRQPLIDQPKLLRDPQVRALLARSAEQAYAEGALSNAASVHPQDQMPEFSELQVMRHAIKRNPTVTEVAAERGVSPVELMIDLAVESDLEQVFGRFTGWTDEGLFDAMRHPHTVMTFSDSGAHISTILGASIQTRLLADWVRDRQAFTLEEAVRMLSFVPARAWGIPERGLVREGMIADLNVFDQATIAPGVPVVELDLPAGAPRIKQKAKGVLATVVAGAVTFEDGEHSGALPGRLLRRGLGSTPHPGR
jgi:N-acyl-D-aspartate/D-glutamate deacylase